MSLHTSAGEFGEALINLLGLPKFCTRVNLRAEAGNLVEVDVVHYVDDETTPIKAMREVFSQYAVVPIATVIKINAMVAALMAAEAFIVGFEDDELQEGIDDLLANIRNAIAEATA